MKVCVFVLCSSLIFRLRVLFQLHARSDCTEWRSRGDSVTWWSVAFQSLTNIFTHRPCCQKYDLPWVERVYTILDALDICLALIYVYFTCLTSVLSRKGASLTGVSYGRAINTKMFLMVLCMTGMVIITQFWPTLFSYPRSGSVPAKARLPLLLQLLAEEREYSAGASPSFHYSHHHLGMATNKMKRYSCVSSLF